MRDHGDHCFLVERSGRPEYSDEVGDPAVPQGARRLDLDGVAFVSQEPLEGGRYRIAVREVRCERPQVAEAHLGDRVGRRIVQQARGDVDLLREARADRPHELRDLRQRVAVPHRGDADASREAAETQVK